MGTSPRVRTVAMVMVMSVMSVMAVMALALAFPFAFGHIFGSYATFAFSFSSFRVFDAFSL